MTSHRRQTAEIKLHTFLFAAVMGLVMDVHLRKSFLIENSSKLKWCIFQFFMLLNFSTHDVATHLVEINLHSFSIYSCDGLDPRGLDVNVLKEP